MRVDEVGDARGPSGCFSVNQVAQRDGELGELPGRSARDSSHLLPPLDAIADLELRAHDARIACEQPLWLAIVEKAMFQPDGAVLDADDASCRKGMHRLLGIGAAAASSIPHLACLQMQRVDHDTIGTPTCMVAFAAEVLITSGAVRSSNGKVKTICEVCAHPFADHERRRLLCEGAGAQDEVEKVPKHSALKHVAGAPPVTENRPVKTEVAAVGAFLVRRVVRLGVVEGRVQVVHRQGRHPYRPAGRAARSYCLPCPRTDAG